MLYIFPNSTGDIVRSQQEFREFCCSIDPDNAVRRICKVEKTILFRVLCSCGCNSSRVAHFLAATRSLGSGEGKGE